MNYSDRLTTLSSDIPLRYIGSFRDRIEEMGRLMEDAGYDPSDILRLFRRMLIALTGELKEDYLFDFLTLGRLSCTFNLAEERCDRTQYPNSFGLLYKLVFGRGGQIDKCRQAVQIEFFTEDNQRRLEREYERLLAPLVDEEFQRLAALPDGSSS